MPLTIENLLDCGPMPYREALELQRFRVRSRQAGEIGDRLLLLEHAPTVTYGKTTRPENLRLSPSQYAEQGIDLIETDRGGDATYHGPGQIVGYLIVHLGEGGRDVHRFVRRLEGAVIDAARQLGVAAADRALWHAGVWVGDGYLAALGVKVTRWVTYHGFALNVTDRVRPGFETIVPCGVGGKRITTVAAETRRDLPMEEAASELIAAFQRAFSAESR